MLRRGRHDYTVTIENDIRYAVQLLIKYPSFFAKELDKQTPDIPEERLSEVRNAVSKLGYELGMRHYIVTRRKYFEGKD